MIPGETKNRFIESWRGIGIALVLWYHYSSRIPFDVMGATRPPTVMFQLGTCGVLAFFIISGYLIAASLSASPNVASFYAKRISRIWPLFIVAAITVTLAMQFLQPPVVVGGADSFYDTPRHWYDLPGSLFFLADFGFQWPDGAFWSILVELKFYAMIGLFAAARPKDFGRWFAIFAIAAAGPQIVVEVFLPGRFGGVLQATNGLLVARYLPFFAIGVLLFARRVDMLLTVCMLIASARVVLIANDTVGYSSTDTLKFLTLFGAILAIDGLVLGNRLFRFLGKYSYSLYLFHQMIGLSLIRIFVRHMSYDAAILLASALMLAWAWAMSKAFEWRFRRSFYSALYGAFSRMGLDRLTIASSTGESRDKAIGERRTGRMMTERMVAD